MQEQLMGPPNGTWRSIIDQAAHQPEILKDSEVIKNVQNILQTNVSVCTSLGHSFLSQMSRIYTDMLNFYRQATPQPPPFLSPHKLLHRFFQPVPAMIPAAMKLHPFLDIPNYRTAIPPARRGCLF
jgi:hypothetical protein